MAKIMDYTTGDGVDHPQSYWRPVQINLNLNGSGSIAFLGYHDQTTRDAGNDPIGSHIYNVTPDLFTQLFARGKQAPPVDYQAQSYQLAMIVKDVGLDQNRENGRSFFEGAIDG